MVVVMAVAGVIFVGHDGEDAYGHGDVYVNHHHSRRVHKWTRLEYFKGLAAAHPSSAK